LAALAVGASTLLNAATVSWSFGYGSATPDPGDFWAVYTNPGATLLDWSGYGGAGSWSFTATVGTSYYVDYKGCHACGTARSSFTASTAGTFTISGSAITFTAGSPPPPAPYKLKQPIRNSSTVTARYLYSMTDSLGNVYSGTMDLAPGMTGTLDLELPSGATPGALVFTQQEVNSDGAVIRSNTVTVPGTDPAWQQTTGTPTTATTGTGPAPSLPTDTTSKTSTAGIEFAAGANAAKDETLQTGFRSLRQSLGEQSGKAAELAAQQRAADAAASSLAHSDSLALKASVDSIKGRFDTAAAAGLDSLASGPQASAAAAHSSSLSGIYAGAVSAFNSVAMPAAIADPTLWQVTTPLLSFDFNPRQMWPDGSAVNTIRIFTRGMCLVIVSLGLAYLISGRVLEAVREVAQGEQLKAVNGLEGVGAALSIPVYVTIVLAIYATLFTALGVGVAALWSQLSFTLGAVPPVLSEIVSVVDSWTNVVVLGGLLLGYAVFRVTVNGSVSLAVFLKQLLPSA